MEDYVSSVTDGDHQAPPKVSNGVPFLVISNVASEFIDFANTRYVPQDYYDAIQFDRKPERGDILFTVTGSYGIVVKVNTDKQFCFQRHIGLIKPIIDNDYLVYALRSQYVKKLCDDLSTGTAQKTVGLDTLRSFLIPIPPLQEQKRIVESIEHCLLFVDCIEENKGNLQDTIKQTKSKILDLAIHGKLVPQDPKNEPATELLKRINPKAEITCDNPHYRKLPFQIPSTWAWCSHNDVLEISGGSQPAKRFFSSVPQKGYVRLYQIRDYGENPIPVYIPIEYAMKQTEEGDILLARYGGSLGKVFHAEKGAYNVAMAKVIFKDKDLINKEYAYFYYLSDLYQGRLKEISRTAQAGFNSSDFNEMYFPLPPYEEQQRIVNAINEAFTTLNAIAENL